MNLGVSRIIVIAALVVGGLVVLASGFGDGGPSPAASSRTTTQSPSGTTTRTHSKGPKPTPKPRVKGAVVEVFNGTSQSGIAGTLQDQLVADGYSAPNPAADSAVKPLPKTIVYYRADADAAQNKSDATHLAKVYLNGAKVDQLGPDQGQVPNDVEIAVFLGLDYAQKNP